MRGHQLRKLVALVAATTLLALGSSPDAGARDRPTRTRRVLSSAEPSRAVALTNNLPAASKNVDLLRRLRLTRKEDGVSAIELYKGYAYVGASYPHCQALGGSNAGVHVVDIRTPTEPKKVRFLGGGAHDYVGNGIRALHLNNDSFVGDILVAGYAPCDQQSRAGFDIWDITNPRSPQLLVNNFGDFDVFGEPYANTANSVFAWNDSGRSYAVISDAEELYDVDIFDITNPMAPVLVRETGLPDWPAAEVDGQDGEAFNHDMIVKKIDGHFVLAASYWDAGYVFLNVDDPANPTFLNDTNYPGDDPLGFTPPEGNAAAGGWNWNGNFFIGADQDVDPNREILEILTGPSAGEYPGSEFDWTVPIASFPEGTIQGTTVFGGTGCPSDVNGNGTNDRLEVPAASSFNAHYSAGEERILVLNGAPNVSGCGPWEQIASGQAQGWHAVVIGQSHSGTSSGTAPDQYECVPFTPLPSPTIPGACIGHRATHVLFGDTPEYGSISHEGADLPAIGTVGEDLAATSMFDGWGYTHLFRQSDSTLIDDLTIPQTTDESKASGWGFFTAADVAVDTRARHNLVYSTWKNGGFRVTSFGGAGFVPRGLYRHRGGNRMFGVDFLPRGDRAPIVGASDRDFGLYLFRYTGPGAR